MDFTVNEQGCAALIDNMRNYMTQIRAIIDGIDSHEAMLREALGNDSQAVAATVRTMRSELENAQRELDTITADMVEYVARVNVIKDTLS